jgi:ATP-dependent RNA helicase DeaD
VHRIGRTGRAGRTGEAILFVTPRERGMLRAIERATRQPIEPMEAPSIEAVNERRVDRFLSRISEALESPDLGTYRELIERFEQERNVPAVEIAAALAHLVQGESPLLMDTGHDPLRQPPRHERDARGPRDRQGHGEREQRGDRSAPGHRYERDARAPRAERTFDRPPQGERGERPVPRFDGERDARRAPHAERSDAAPRSDFERSGPRFDRPSREDRGFDERPAPPAFRNDAERTFDDRPRERAPRQAPEVGMETFRIEVGHQHGVKPGNIVGAIANEADLESRYIGRIDIRDSFTLIDLPEGMPSELMDHLRRVRVAGQQLKISRDTGAPPRREGAAPRFGSGGAGDRGDRGGPRHGGPGADRGGPRHGGPGNDRSGPRRGGPGGGFAGRPPRRDR